MSAWCTLYTQVISNSCSWFHTQVMLHNLLMFLALSFFTCLALLSFKFQLRYFLLPETFQSPLPCHVPFSHVPEVAHWRRLDVRSGSLNSLRIKIISYSSLCVSVKLHACLVVWAREHLATGMEERGDTGAQWDTRGSWMSQEPSVSWASLRRGCLYGGFVQMHSMSPDRTIIPLLNISEGQNCYRHHKSEVLTTNRVCPT